nr:unnamed protein product [Callosobruchus chinensis]
MSHSLHGTYVSEKINKIRWKPDEFNNCHFFVTGSIDNEENFLKLWDFTTILEDDIYPFQVASLASDGDITEIKFLDTDTLVTSTSSGSVYLIRVCQPYNDQIHLKTSTEWQNIHHFDNGESSPCTALAVYEKNDIVSVGEDGCINLLNSQSQRIFRRIGNADSCSIHSVLFLKHDEILTSNLRGQMKVWDLRNSSDKPSNTFMLSGDQVTSTCLTCHPTQRHLLISGDDLGALTTWDLRHNTYPINVLNAHEGAITEIQFHPDQPDHLFSCSSAGEIWHWSTKAKTVSSLIPDSDTNVWLTHDNVKNKLEVFTLMPTLGKAINTLDLSKNAVICGCDNEAIYLINGVTLC